MSPYRELSCRSLRAGSVGGRGHRGQSLVELALTIPLILMILLGTVDLGRMFFGYIELRNAAFEGARYAITVPSDTSGITDRVTQHGVPAGTTVTVTCKSGDSDVDCSSLVAGASVTVTVTANATFSPITTTFMQQYFGIGSFMMTGSATTRVAT